MKTIIRNIFVAGLSGLLFVVTTSCSKDGANRETLTQETVLEVAADGESTLLAAKLGVVLTDNLTFGESELEILLNLKEEEKLARDVYTALGAKWNRVVFTNISKAENTHMNAVIYLLTGYGAEYTSISDPGIFTNPVYQQLYTDLVAKGSESVGEAYKIGALIEEMDITDIEKDLAEVTNENIITVFENLQRGSRNHLRAFNRQLKFAGLTYTPVYLDQQEYDEIISSPVEAGKAYMVSTCGSQTANCPNQ
jgi:hypothetical protein